MSQNTVFPIQALSAYFKPILAVSSLWQGKELHPYIIVNPCSGGFTIKKRAEVNRSIFSEEAKKAAAKKIVTEVSEIKLYQTEYSGHASFLTKEIITEAKKARSNAEFLIIIAGGNGTCRDVQSTMVRYAFESEENYTFITSRITVLKLPFGTGNDGLSGRTLLDSLKLISDNSVFALEKAVKVTPNNYAQNFDCNYAFNIASIGIDAYVTYKTHKMHSIKAGDFYNHYIKLACLFYSLKYPTDKIKIELFDSDGKLKNTIDGKLLFCLLGASGNRTYGSNNKILPDKRNFCFTPQMSVAKKFSLKRHIKTGTHVEHNFSVLDNAEKIIIYYNNKVLLQMDGEVHALTQNNFPLAMELTEPVIRTLKFKENAV